MWQGRFGYREGIFIISGLAFVGLLLQVIAGPIPATAFAYPFSLVGGSLLLAGILFWGIFHRRAIRRNSARFSFLSGHIATLTSIGGLLLLAVIMGLTKQIPAEMGRGLQHPIHRLGLSSMLSAWYFLLLYLYLLFVLGCVTTDRLMRLKLNFRDGAFVMNHVGLFIALFFGLMSSADIRQYRMQVYSDSDYPEWRGIDQRTKKMVELPVAIELKKFEIAEYPPKLMIIRNNSGKALPYSRPAHLSIDRTPSKGTIDRWQIEVLAHLPYSAAVVTKDSVVFREFRSLGAVHSARVRAANLDFPQEVVSGWVSSGSHVFPYRSLRLTDSLSLVMAEPDPKQYSSQVYLYAENGEIDSATILVNKPLRYRGWYIYQLSYNREQGRWSTMSELELVKDDWLYGVYTGIGLLLIGAAMLFLGPIPASTQAKREDHD